MTDNSRTLPGTTHFKSTGGVLGTNEIDIVHDGTNGTIQSLIGNIKLLAGAGSHVTISGLSFPNADGTANQILVTGGDGLLSFQTFSTSYLSDFNITSPATGNILYYNGSHWVNVAPGATSGVQAYNANLTTFAGLTPGSSGNVLVSNGSAWTSAALTGTQVLAGYTGTAYTGTSTAGIATALSGIDAVLTTINTNVSGKQAASAQLTTLAGLTPTTDGFIVGNGSAFAVETGNPARRSLGLGTTDSPTFAGLTSVGTLTVDNGTVARGTAGAVSLFADAGTNTVTVGDAASTMVVAGNLQVNGTTTTVNSTTLTVNADAIVVNHNGSTSTSGGAGVNIEGDAAAIVGWLRVNGANTALLELKAPTGSNLTIATTAATEIDFGAASIGQTIRFDGSKFVNSKLAIDDLSNVVITSPGTNQLLMYNGSQWINGTMTIVTSLSGLSDVTITSVASGNILYYNGTKWVNSAPGSVAGVQPYNANLNTISGLSAGSNSVIVGNGSSWASAILNGSQVTAGYTGTAYTGTSTASIATSLSGVDAALTTINTNVGNKQPLNANLTTIAGLAQGTNNVLVSNGTAWTSAVLDGTQVLAGHTGVNYTGTSTAGIATSLGGIDTALGNKQPVNSNLTTIAGLTPGTNDVLVGNGSVWTSAILSGTQVTAGYTGTSYTGTSTAGIATSLSGIDTALTTINTNVGNKQPLNANLTTISGLTPGTAGNVLVSNGTAWTSAILSGTQVTAGYTGTAYTGTSTAPVSTSLSGIDAALTTINTNVGNKQPLNANLTTISGLTPGSSGNVLVSNGAAWTSAALSGTQVTAGYTGTAYTGTSTAGIATSLSGIDAALTTINTNVSGKQAASAQLTTLAGLTPASNAFIVGNGSVFTTASGDTARHDLGLGTADSPIFTGLTTTGSITVDNGTIARGSAGAVSLFADSGTNTITVGGASSTTVIAGNLQVNGTTTTVNSTTMTVNAAAVVVNHNGSTSTTGGAGVNIEGDAAAIVGWIRVNGANTALLELKAPTGSNLTFATTAATEIDFGAATTGQTIRYNGSKFVNAKLAIDDLSNVVITSPGTNQVLTYNGSQWVNGTVSVVTALSGLSDVTITSVASGNILYYNGSKWVNSAPGAAAGVQAYNANLNTIAGLSAGSNSVIVGNGSVWTSAVLTGAAVLAGYTGTAYTGTSTAGIATSLSGIDAALTTINTNVSGKQTASAQLTTLSGLTPASNAVIIGNGSAFATQSGATLRSSLGLAIGTNVEAWNANLDTIAGLAQGTNNVIISNGAAWTSAALSGTAVAAGYTGTAYTGTSTASIATALSGIDAALTTINTNVSNKQGSNANLTTIAGLTPGTAGNIIVSNGSAWSVGTQSSSGATTLDVNFNSADSVGARVNLTGTSVTSGYQYTGTAGYAIVSSILACNINGTNEQAISAWLSKNNGTGALISLGQIIPIPANTSVELLKQPKVLASNDLLKFQASNGSTVQIETTIQPYPTNTKLWNAGTNMTSAGTNVTIYTEANTNGSVIESILLANVDSGTNGVRVSVILNDGTNDTYLCSTLNVPQKATVEICDKPKFIPNTGTIKVYVSDANRLDISAHGRKL